MERQDLGGALRAVTAGTLLALGMAASPAALAQNNMPQNGNPFGCACLHNNTNRDISYRYHWGDNQWKNYTLKANYQQWLCWKYAPGSSSSPPLQFQIDVDLSNATAWTTYDIPRVQSRAQDCNAFGPKGHYDIGFRPNTNNSFVHITRRQ